LILFGGAMAAMVLGPVWGKLLDRFGSRQLVAPAVLASSATVALLGLATKGWSLGLLWILGGATAALVAVVFQALGATIMPDNRGGALSFLLSFRFLGHAAGPAAFVPLVEQSAPLAFVLAGSLGLISIGAATMATRT
jgi:ACDE family multidrug resistance protein